MIAGFGRAPREKMKQKLLLIFLLHFTVQKVNQLLGWLFGLRGATRVSYGLPTKKAVLRYAVTRRI
jgi:hypothetical protein